MGHLRELTPDALLEAVGVVAAVMADHAEAIDSLELRSIDASGDEDSPGNGDVDVPEGAGTDLAATLASACAHTAGGRDLCSVTRSLYSGSVTGARGAAGRNLSTVLLSLSEVTTNADVIDGSRFALGLELAAERLLEERVEPEIGTMPSVVAASATGALSALDQGLDLGDILIAASDHGLAELEAGPVANPALAEHGTVDPAAAGFLLVLDALSAVVTGEPFPEAPKERPDPPGSLRGTKSGSDQFVIRCQVEPLDGCGVEAAAWLESTWHEIGELIEFQVRSDRWNVQLQTTLPGSAVEALCTVGVPTELHIGLVPDSSAAERP